MSSVQNKKASIYHGMQLLIVQSTVCVFLIVSIIVLRWLGGSAFDELASRFRDAMLEDTLITANADSINTSVESVYNDNYMIQPSIDIK